jgi:hypothetical protein
LFGGWMSGWLIGRGWSVDKARKWAITLGGVFMLPALLLTIGAATPLNAVLLIAVILFGFQIAINNIQTCPATICPAGRSDRWPGSAAPPRWPGPDHHLDRPGRHQGQLRPCLHHGRQPGSSFHPFHLALGGTRRTPR